MGKIKIGLTDGFYSYDYGSPEYMLNVIDEYKRKNLDVIVGPEWGLNAKPEGLYSTRQFKNLDDFIDNAFTSETKISDYAPKDAKSVLLKNRDSIKFRKPNNVPYSEAEAYKVIDALKEHSKNCDTLILPGTMVSYDDKGKLLNYMPVIQNGKHLKNIYKISDGGTRFFSLFGLLKLGIDEENCDKEYFVPENNVLYADNRKVGVEICADSGLLREVGVKDLDLQVLSSCGNSTIEPAVEKGKYVVCADGASGEYFVKKLYGKEVKKKSGDLLSIFTDRLV